ncbi:MAG TPA: outer membrane lipoprotein-sorting protein [Fibrobacteria bacterium]|nr:outer membrane lipoprotein-sorting protein [Fibrobacteria bacterium]
MIRDCFLPAALAASLCLGAVPAAAQSSAVEIMAKVDQVAREAFNSSIMKIKLATCQYTVANKSMRCLDAPRVSIVENVRKDFGADLRDSRSVAVVIEPAGDKGISMLTHQYDATEKENDTWLYLPAMGKVKRIVSSGNESGSFFGSEFAIEDMESRKLGDYTYKILDRTTYNERRAVIVESVPTAKRANQTQYGKVVTWVDEERYIVLKEDLYDRNGKLAKQQIMRNIELIDGVWLSRKTTMNNLASRRVTTIDMLSVAFGVKVSDEFLTQRSLMDFAFREKNLEQLRTDLK